MGVLERCPGGFPVILEDDDQLDPAVLSQREIPFPISKENLLYLSILHQGEDLVVDGTLDHYFMDADSIHHPEKPRPVPLQAPVQGEGRKPVGDHPDPPSSTIRRAAASIGERLVRSELLVTPAEGAVFPV